MSILLTRGNAEDVFEVLDNHNIDSALELDNKLKALKIIVEKNVDTIELWCAEYYYQYNKEVYEKYHNDDMLLDEKEFYTLKRWVE